MNVDAKIPAKVLMSLIQQFMKRIIHHTQVGFIPGMKGWFDMQKSIIVVHHVRACVLSHFSCIRFFVTLWIVAHQAPLFHGILQEGILWRGLPYPLPGALPYPGIEPMSLMSPALAGKFFIAAGKRRKII